MVCGIGIDIADIDRFSNAGDFDLLLGQFLTVREIGFVRSSRDHAGSAAKLFSAKEAVVKALGCGLVGGWHWHEIEIDDADRVTLSGFLKTTAQELSVSGIHVSHSLSGNRSVSLALLDRTEKDQS